jgi:D-alanine-D-alanine ligase
MGRVKPGVIFGGPSPEHDVSVLTGLQAARAIGGEVTAVYWDKSGGLWQVDAASEGADFLEGPPRGSRPLRLVAGPGGGFVGGKAGVLGKEKPLELDALVNCCHGGPGEDGTLQGALDLAGLPYTGPTVSGAVLGMDKLVFAGAVGAAGLPVLSRVPIQPGAAAPAFAGPYIVKPRFGGSSIGIEVTDDWATALSLLSASVHYRSGAVAEPYRPAAGDLEVGVRTYPALEHSLIARPLRSSDTNEILGYRDKYLGGEGMVSAQRELPARLEPAVEKAVTEAARTVAEVCGVRGLARVDFLLDGDELFINEINTIPGSLTKYLWEAPFPKLLADMLEEAVTRPSCRYDATGADGLALRSAATIASKLG